MLRALAETFVSGGEAVRLADHLIETIASLPRRSDREEIARLLQLLESRTMNLVLAGSALPFTAMSHAQSQGQWLSGQIAGLG